METRLKNALSIGEMVTTHKSFSICYIVRSISIYNKYSHYNGDGEWKDVVQAVRHALTGKCEKELDKLLNDTDNWG